MTRETLLANAPIPEDHIHPVPDTGTPEEAAAKYETVLKRVYGSDRLESSRFLFHVQFLGLGPDGHTASLIPGQPVLDERKRWVAAVTAGRAEPRVTLTYPTIESSHTIVFLVAGADKAAALKAARAGDTRLPAARIVPLGDVVWFVDRAAAGTG